MTQEGNSKTRSSRDELLDFKQAKLFRALLSPTPSQWAEVSKVGLQRQGEYESLLRREAVRAPKQPEAPQPRQGPSGNPLFPSRPCPRLPYPSPVTPFQQTFCPGIWWNSAFVYSPLPLLGVLSHVCSKTGDFSPVLCHTCESRKVNLGEGHEVPAAGSGGHLRVQTKPGFLTPASACRPRVPPVLISACVSVCRRGMRRWGKWTLPKWLRATLKGVMSCPALQAYLSNNG